MQTGEEKNIWTPEQFRDKIWAIHPEGDFNMTYNITKGQVLTISDFSFEFLEQKYREYYNAKSSLQADNPTYTKKENQIVMIVDFVQDKMWRKNFVGKISKTDPVLDNYLFGPDIINKEE